VLGDCLGFGAGWVLLREGLYLESMAPLRERERERERVPYRWAWNEELNMKAAPALASGFA
jgi:hypothetical protein